MFSSNDNRLGLGNNRLAVLKQVETDTKRINRLDIGW